MSKFKRSNASSDNEIKDSVRFQDFLSNMIAYFLMKFRKIGHTYTTITGNHLVDYQKVPKYCIF